MIKKLIFLLFIILCSHLIAQIELQFIDDSNKKPIYFVQLYDSKNELIAITDLNGKVSILNYFDSIIIAKHLDFKTVKIPINNQKIISLRPLTQTLEEVKVVPIKGKNLLHTILINSKIKIPTQNFYGKFHFQGSMYELTFDSISRKINDSIIKHFDAEIKFQYLYDEKKKKRKIVILPEKVNFSFASFNNSKNASGNFHENFNYFLDAAFLFEKDFDSDYYTEFTNKKKYSINREINADNQLKLQSNNGKDKVIYKARIKFDMVDSSIVYFESTHQKIIHNSIGREIQELVFYDTFSSIYYPKQAAYHFYLKNGICEELKINITEIKLGKVLNFEDYKNFRLKEYCKALIPTFLPFEKGKFPKRFYELNRE